MKTTTHITITHDLKDKIKKLGINTSQVCEDALHAKVQSLSKDPKTLAAANILLEDLEEKRNATEREIAKVNSLLNKLELLEMQRVEFFNELRVLSKRGDLDGLRDLCVRRAGDFGLSPRECFERFGFG